MVARRFNVGDGVLRPPTSTCLKQMHSPFTLLHIVCMCARESVLIHNSLFNPLVTHSSFLYILETLSRLRQMIMSAMTLLA